MPASPAPEPTPPIARKVRVGLGIGATPFENARTLFRWADLCEEGDVDSLWQTDRLASREPYLEALSTMAALAGATERIRFGMNAVVVSWRDPLLLAKQCATVDWLSGGRLLPVFGVGSEASPEWAATGRSPRGRGRLADEALEIMSRLWSEESVDFDGEHYRYRGASIAPRPVQQPLPLWIGGHSPAAVRRTARIGTGWLAGLLDPDAVAPVVESIRKASAESGRPLDDDHYGATFLFRLGSRDDEAVAGFERARARGGAAGALRVLVVGDARDVVARIEGYRLAGISKFVGIPVARGDADLLDQTRRLCEEVLPHVHGDRIPREAT